VYQCTVSKKKKKKLREEKKRKKKRREKSILGEVLSYPLEYRKVSTE
jgi:hypothetical protein